MASLMRDTALVDVSLFSVWSAIWLTFGVTVVIIIMSPVSIWFGWLTLAVQLTSLLLVGVLFAQALARYCVFNTKYLQFQLKRESRHEVTFHFQRRWLVKSLSAWRLRKVVLQEAPGALRAMVKKLPSSVSELSVVTPWCSDRDQVQSGRAESDLLAMLRIAFPGADIVRTSKDMDRFQSFIAMNYGAQKHAWRRRFSSRRWFGKLQSTGFTVLVKSVQSATTD